MERILVQNLLGRRQDRGRLCRLIILYIIWESHPPELFMGVAYTHYLIARDNTVRPQPDRICALINTWVEKGFIARPDGVPAQNPHEPNAGRSETGAQFATEASYGSYGQNLWSDQAPARRRGLWARLWGRIEDANSISRSPRPDPWMPFSVPPIGESMAALAAPYTLIRWDANPNATNPLQTVTESVSKGDTRFPHRLMIEVSDDFINTHTDPYGGNARQAEPTCDCGHNLEYKGTAGWLDTRKIRRACPVCGQAFRPQDQLAEIRNGEDGTIFVQPGGLCNRFAIIIDFGKDMPFYRLEPNGVLVDAIPKVTDVFLQTCTTALGIELNEFRYLK
jgi:hypothetical protein